MSIENIGSLELLGSLIIIDIYISNYF